MRKSTILMIAVVFVASVLIVGIFGMKIFTIGKINYVKELIIDETCFSVDNQDAQTGFKITENKDGSKKYSYTILTKKDSPLNLTITPKLIPTIQDTELTNPEITTVFNHNSPENAKTTFENGVFTMLSDSTGTDSFVATLKTNDGSNFHLSITVIVIFTL